MHITIAERLKPFSLLPGTLCLLPGSYYRLEIFPALLRVYGMQAGEPQLLTEAVFTIRGPVKDFFVQQDLEKGAVHVMGRCLEGYFRYTMKAVIPEGISLQFEKSFPGLSCEVKRAFPLFINEKGAHPLFVPPQTDRLSLGSHKTQDWQIVCRRANLEELFPAWLRLGQIVPAPEPASHAGCAAWLDKCAEALERAGAEKILDPFMNLFLTGFEGVLSPRLKDGQYQGMELPSDSAEAASPLSILTDGAKLIRQLFLTFQENNLFLLLKLPSQFHCGRLINVNLGGFGILHLEWSKKTLRRVVIEALLDAEIGLHVQTKLHSFRLRKGMQDQGIRLTCPSKLEIKRGSVYFLDNFQK